MILLTNTTPASLRSALPSSAEEGNLKPLRLYVWAIIFKREFEDPFTWKGFIIDARRSELPVARGVDRQGGEVFAGARDFQRRVRYTSQRIDGRFHAKPYF